MVIKSEKYEGPVIQHAWAPDTDTDVDIIWN